MLAWDFHPIRCSLAKQPPCINIMSTNEDFPQTQSSDPSPLAASLESTDLIPTDIGRFRIEAIFGKGGFGVVYLGHDEQLQRKVAIKVPRPQFVQRPEDRELYLKEARTVAGLEHPNIVPVHEVGTTPESTLLAMLRKRLDAEHLRYDKSWKLVQLVTSIRRGHILPANKKVLLVVDQFEQWLYAHMAARLENWNRTAKKTNKIASNSSPNRCVG